MKIVRGIKIGGLQQKVFNLMLLFILTIVLAYSVFFFVQQKNLSKVVQEANVLQQESITQISEKTMDSVLNTTMARTTALQAHIANELFGEVQGVVLTLQNYATELFAHESNFQSKPVAPPSASDDGTTTVQLVHEAGVDPEDSRLLGTVGNMGEIMCSFYDGFGKFSSIFVGTADGNMVLVNDRASVFVNENGSPRTLDIRHRPWYAQAAEAGEMIFTSVELDAYTENPMLECAAPVYRNGELVAVVAADIYLNSINDYVKRSTSNGGFLCVVSQDGKVLFSPMQGGIFQARLSVVAPDLRQNENTGLAQLVEQALRENTGLREITVEGTEYFVVGVPMPSVGWAVLSLVEKELTRQPTVTMLTQYENINGQALQTFAQSSKIHRHIMLILTILIVVLALWSALAMSSRMVKPLEAMTKRVCSLSGTDLRFNMEDAFRTGDEIEVLAESFAMLSGKTLQYIEMVQKVTAEKERIGTELALASRIQADMLPNIFPPFPERKEFDIYAVMDPAKEVGGDFYDFFLIDDTHLGMVMADVSGKGVPAALFMMISKILVQNFAMTGISPAEVLRVVNNQICSNNREEMFVTVWFGVLDTVTGKITAANAGHEYPALKLGESFELFKDKHGFVIGGMEGVKYKEYELQLVPGSKLFLYTDGVPEATNGEQELFGTERMLAALNADPSVSPEQILKNVRSAVDGFVKDAEQFDDLTMLCIEFRGGK